MAQTVFNNSMAFIFTDEAHSQEEPRELFMGHSNWNRILLISFTERIEGVRIINASVATRRERKDSEKYRQRR